MLASCADRQDAPEADAFEDEAAEAGDDVPADDAVEDAG